MTGQPGLHGPNDDDGQEAEEFLQRMVGSLVVAKVRQSRSQGLGDEAIRKEVLAFALERASGLGESGFDAEPHRESLVPWIERALDDALEDSGPDDLAEPLRRITDRVEGEPIVLANGETWTFPRLEHEKIPRTLADGSIDLQYPWIQDPEGLELLTELIWIENGRSDPRVVLSHLMNVGALLLRRNYSLTALECRQLMPIDPDNPECIGALLTLAPEDLEAESTLASRPIAERTEEIVTRLLTLLAPVIEDIREMSAEE